MKSPSLSPQTPVILVGLEQNPALNNTTGEVIETFDGSRYAVKLEAGGARVRITPDKLSPTRAEDFVQYVLRLMNELCIFAHHNHGGPTDLFPIKPSALGAPRKALSSKLARVELSSDHKILKLYEGDSTTPYAQLKPQTEIPPGATAKIALPDFDSPTALRDVDLDADSIMLTCGGTTIFFDNHVSMFHLPIDHMTTYMTERMTVCIVDNFLDATRYMHNADDVETVTYDAASRALLYKLKSSNSRGRIVCPSWTAEAFTVARHGHMTDYRFVSLGKALAATPPSHAVHIYPIGAIGHRDQTTLTVEDDGTHDTSGLVPSADTFLQSQLVLCSHFVKYGTISHWQSVPPGMCKYANGILSLICDKVCSNPEKECARLAQYIMTSNVSDGTHFLLSAQFMDDIYTSEDKFVAWLANLEALLNAFTIALEGRPTLAIENGLFRACNENSGAVVYVGSFANDPLENQAWIFQRELGNVEAPTLSLPCGIARLTSSLSFDMSSNADDAVHQVMHRMRQSSVDVLAEPGTSTPTRRASATKLPDGPAHDDALVEERLRMQAALIEEEEAAKVARNSAMHAPGGGKKKKNKKKNTKSKHTSGPALPTPPAPLVALSLEPSTGPPPTPLVAQSSAPSSGPPPFVQSSPLSSSTDTQPSDLTPIVSSARAGHFESHFEMCESDAQHVESHTTHADAVPQSESVVPSPPTPLSDAMETAGDCSDARDAEFVAVVGSRASARRAVARLKQSLAVAYEHIGTLESERAAAKAGFENELGQQRSAHESEMQGLRASCSAEALRLNDHLAQRVSAHNGLREEHAQLVAANLSNSRTVADHEAGILDKIASQLRHYLSGHYMKLDKVTLSIPAVLRDGYVAALLIDIYRNFVAHPRTPEDVIALAVHRTDDMALTGYGGIGRVTTATA